MKVKIGTTTDESLKRIIEIQIEKLSVYKRKGYGKEKLYKIFTKVFVDKYY